MVQAMVENGSPESNIPNREELLQMAIQTAKTGNKQGARVMFQQVLNQDPRNERALLWMAALGRDKKEQRKFLAATLRVNPKNKTARTQLERMKHAEEARSNRTLVYGGLFIGGLVLVVLLVVIAVLVLPALLNPALLVLV